MKKQIFSFWVLILMLMISLDHVNAASFAISSPVFQDKESILAHYGPDFPLVI